MHSGSLVQLAQLFSIDYSGEDLSYHGVSTDTRALVAGNLFIALQGSNFNGKNFIQEAKARGAVAAVVAEGGIDQSVIDFPLLLVPNTLTALGQLAAAHRATLSAPVIAVTGSCGKTSVKAMIAAIIGQKVSVAVSPGNFNNAIGLPLSLLAASAHDRYIVVEIGTSAPGEIAQLTAIAQPDIAVITNAAGAHLKDLGSIEGVAKEKGALLQKLTARGVAVLNASDPYFALWQEMVPQDASVIAFASNVQSVADLQAKQIVVDHEGHASFSLQLATGEACRIRLALLGQHHVANVLAASAVALHLGFTLAQIKVAMEALSSLTGRVKLIHAVSGLTVIDDSYNANPMSVKAGIELLANYPPPRALILGEMRELGEQEAQYHQEIGDYAHQMGIEYLLTLGDLTRHAVASFSSQGIYFTCCEQLINQAMALLPTGTTVLVKGSRAMKMERVVAALIKSSAEEDES